MRITIIAVGKLKEKYLKEAVREYSKRLSKFCILKIVEVPDEKASDKLSVAEELSVKRKEADKVRKHIGQADYVIVLDLQGEQPDSLSLAAKMNQLMISGKSSFTFILGGSLGLDEELVRQSNLNLCLSNLTFPHQLARIIILEQVYRAFKIISGETYHK